MGDSFEDCQLWLFADADHAGEHDSKSTSGCAMFLVGPNTYFPLNAFSKKQTVVAISSTEAEVVSANHALRAEGIPMLALLEQLGIFKKMSQKAGTNPKPNTPEQDDPVFTRIDREIVEIRYGNVEGGLSAANINGLKAKFPEFYHVKFMEDNEASITVMSTGNSSTMRYANKTQNICFKWMKQQFEKDDGSTPGCRKWLAQEVQSFRENSPQGEVLLYASLPCVGGSPWGYINRLTDSGAERIEQQQKDFTKLFKSLQKLIHEINGPYLAIAFELSKNCKYWKWPMVQSFLKKQDLKLYPFHGCQFGVTDLEGNPMKKGWMIATDMEELSSLPEYVCDGSHTHGQSREPGYCKNTCRELHIHLD